MPSSRGTTPPPSHPSSSRTPPIQPHPHAPLTPSGLREAHTLSQSPEETHMMPGNKENTAPGSSQNPLRSPPIDLATRVNAANGPGETRAGLGKTLKDAVEEVATETTTLLKKPYEIITSHTHDGPCNHGTFSPRVESRPMSLMGDDSGRPLSSGEVSIGSKSNNGGIFGSLFGRKTHSTTSSLAERHGVNKTSMYVSYYVPFFAWIPQYKWSYLQGDIVAALTMASFYIPMALSYASNLAHVPPINGLYSFVFNPLIYAFLGSCPQMVVGPEAAGSLLVGSVVRSTVDSGKHNDADEMMNARVAGVVTGIAGAVIFIAGLTRLGFLDSVLSRPFLRGFISAIGFVIVVDQLIPEMGLAELAANADGVVHGSSVTKLGFLINNASHLHALTFAIAFGSFAIIMFFRELKKHLSPRYPNVAYIPDRFVVVVSSAILCWAFEWNKQGLEILGEVKSTTGNPFPFHWPFQASNRKHITEAMGTSFLIALLGFFESSVAAKSIGGGGGKTDGLQGVQLSPNRELVALGVANLVGGCFCALPAFGGYGRSKVNASTGGKTPMSSVFLSIFTIICVLFLLPYFYYLPKAVLSSMITVVAWSLIEEAPHDIAFFVKIRGWTELALMAIIFAATIFYSLTLGIAIGVGLSVLSVIKHSTRPRIQILGRIPGTNRFENAEDNPEKLEFVEGCLIVKIPEPLTFANTGDLKSRLRRLELYGTNLAHPALPRTRPEEHNKNIIFDIHGVTGIDGSGTQVLQEIVTGYRSRGVHVFFTRGPVVGSPIYDRLERSGIIETIGGPDHFVGDVESALRLTEIDIEYGTERM